MTSLLGATSTTPLLEPNREFSPRPPLPRDPSTFRRARRRRSTPPVHLLPALLTITLFILALLVALDVSPYGKCYFAPLCRILGEEREGLDEVYWRNSGAYGPWRSYGLGGGKRGLPRGCGIDQVSVLHRHAARYPTTEGSKCMKRALKKLLKRSIIAPRRHPELAFLSKADYKLEGWHLNDLMDQGRKAAWRSGREVEALYKTALDGGEGVFSRSSGGGRVVETAGYWLQGFNGEPYKHHTPAQLQQPDVILPENGVSNNTLSVHSCTAFNEIERPPLQSLVRLLTPALNRLNSLLQPNPPLELYDLPCLADMCDFDSQAEGDDWKGWSRWCGIFTREEWEVLGHWRDAQRYFWVGEGSRYGPTMGAGYINELIARLSDSAPVDTTSTNRTMDADEKTFPRGGKRLFVDFTHDNEIIEILTAMGVINEHRNPPITYVPAKRTYLTSTLIPFGSRIVFERISCDLGAWEPDPNTGDLDDRQKDGKKDYVRILVNDALVTVDHVACQQSGFVEHGLCELDSFVESQTWATTDVDWAVCSVSQ